MLGLLLVLIAGPGAAPDPGVLLELDRDRYEIRAVDRRTGQQGPRLRVVLGSPSNPTPAGDFPLHWVIENPSWTPDAQARAAGARQAGPSQTTPMGVAKIPFAEGGSIALHGAGDPLALGKPLSSGCVRSLDADLLVLIDWLERSGAVGPPVPREDGERHRPIRRPTHLVVR